MVGLDDQQLTAWVQAWASRYDLNHDERYADLWGRESLDRAAMERLIDWKFVSMPHRRSRAHRRLADESDEAIADVTGAARRCRDDGAALRVIRALNGVGPALGSAALMAMDPLRWTVLDVRALASIRAVGYTDLPDKPQWQSTWMPYLAACRDVARRSDSALRTVDRALFAANGRSVLPR